MTTEQALIAQLRACIRLLYPEEMTPTAKRMLEKILDAHDPAKQQRKETLYGDLVRQFNEDQEEEMGG
jgi:hypothetical protein